MKQLTKGNLKKKLKIPLTRLERESAYTEILGQVIKGWVITLNIADFVHITVPSEFGQWRFKYHSVSVYGLFAYNMLESLHDESMTEYYWSLH
ncbi:unnamed protein product [Brassica oleracea]|uniref:(rape) hypothetical protein n=1 Tax=Brassica napus TaxID=3708 RepID=A0A816MLL6_BRANA|nr:unnamed protein product [Brassica napus]